MEDALVHRKDVVSNQSVSLNPCFNGRCTRTAGYKRAITAKLWVLILVLMEDALALGVAVGVAGTANAS